MSLSASSSSGAAPPSSINVAPGLAGEQADHPANDHRPGIAVALPHTGRVHLDWAAPSQYMATDTLTQERKALPAGVWDMVFDERGKAAFASSDSSFKLADDLFGFEASRDEEGIVYIGWAVAGGSND